MPKGVYVRKPETIAAMVARVSTAAAKENAANARKATRPRRVGYVATGRRGEKFQHVHRLRAEKALGKPLPKGAVVHHPDKDKTNPNARLVICQDAKYHHLLHRRMRIVAAGGDPNLAL